MAKLKKEPITKDDMLEYLNDYSDFSFEIKTLKLLLEDGLGCQHGGTYEDPVTKKNREFDIRAIKIHNNLTLRLAIECKNLREYSPLLISCVPRKENEAFHEVCLSYYSRPTTGPERYMEDLGAGIYTKNVRLDSERSIYKVGEPVGKSCDQIGRELHGDQNLVANNSDVYEKWSQALGSADDLVHSACIKGNDQSDNIYFSLVIPLLVVPNGRLWVVHYDENGNRTCDPKSEDRCSYYVNIPYSPLLGIKRGYFNISHLEFVTVDGLLELIDDLTGSEGKFENSFQAEYAEQTLYS